MIPIIEELLIKIKSVLDNDGFRKAETSMKGLESSGNSTNGVLGRLGVTTRQLGAGMMAMGAAGVAAMGMLAYMAVQAAASSEQNWGRLTVALGKTGMEMDSVRTEYKGMVDSIASDTARSRGDIVSAIGNLARVGVVNKEIAQTSVEAMSALAMIKYPGDPAGFNTVSEAWTNMINKPTLMVKTLATAGIDTKKFDQVLKENGYTMESWASLTTEQRTNLLNLTVAQQNGAAANDAYKKSYQGIMAQLTNLWQQFITEIGYELLPILKEIGDVMLPILKGLLDGFKSLPGPVKDFLIVLAFVLPILMLIGGAAIYFVPLIAGFGTIATGATVSEAAVWGLYASLGAIIALGAIIVVIKIIDDWSGSRLEDPEYFNNTFKNRNFKPEEKPQAQGVKDFYDNMPVHMLGENFSLDTMFNNWDIVSSIKTAFENHFKEAMGSSVIKWPSAKEILSGILAAIGRKINPLGWKIPGIADILVKIGQFISPLVWSLPSSGEILNMIQRIATGQMATGSSGTTDQVFTQPFRGLGGDSLGIQKGIYTGLGLSKGNKQTVIAPVIKIGSIADKSTADHFAQQITKYLATLNNAKGN